MEERPLVSIVIPNYNYADVLGRCLAAAAAQTYENTEVLLVDDCSTDNSLAVAAQHPCTVFSTPTNSGEAAARNLGVQNSRGDVLFFLDSDLVLQPDAVEKAVNMLRAEPSIGCVYGIYEKTPLTAAGLVKDYRTLQAHYWRVSSLGDADAGFFSIAALRRTVWEQVGPFKPLRVGEEMDYGARVARVTRAVLTDEVRGLHDDEEGLPRLFRKLFVRARVRIPFGFEQGKFAHADETGSRILAALCGAGVVTSAPLGILRPRILGLTLGQLGGFLFLDRGMYAFVWRERRSLPFLASFILLHLCCSAVVVAGGAAGLAQWMASPQYRRLFAPLAEPASVHGGARRAGGLRPKS
jgi:glycosyltransferase involved in cell wall biosynthesis